MPALPSFLRLNNTPLDDGARLTYSSIDGHLGHFLSMAIVNNEHGCTNISLRPSFQLFGNTPRSRIVGSYGNLNFDILENIFILLTMSFDAQKFLILM